MSHRSWVRTPQGICISYALSNIDPTATRRQSTCVCACNASCGNRTLAQLPAVDLKSTPLTSRANWQMQLYLCSRHIEQHEVDKPMYMCNRRSTVNLVACGRIVGQALPTSALGLGEYQQQKSQRTMELQTTSHSDAQQVGEVVSKKSI